MPCPLYDFSFLSICRAGLGALSLQTWFRVTRRVPFPVSARSTRNGHFGFTQRERISITIFATRPCNRRRRPQTRHRPPVSACESRGGGGVLWRGPPARGCRYGGYRWIETTLSRERAAGRTTTIPDTEPCNLGSPAPLKAQFGAAPSSGRFSVSPREYQLGAPLHSRARRSLRPLGGLGSRMACYGSPPDGEEATISRFVFSPVSCFPSAVFCFFRLTSAAVRYSRTADAISFFGVPVAALDRILPARSSA